jgi:hypothetical protein
MSSVQTSQHVRDRATARDRAAAVYAAKQKVAEIEKAAAAAAAEAVRRVTEEGIYKAAYDAAYATASKRAWDKTPTAAYWAAYWAAHAAGVADGGEWAERVARGIANADAARDVLDIAERTLRRAEVGAAAHERKVMRQSVWPEP